MVENDCKNDLLMFTILHQVFGFQGCLENMGDHLWIYCPCKYLKIKELELSHSTHSFLEIKSGSFWAFSNFLTKIWKARTFFTKTFFQYVNFKMTLNWNWISKFLDFFLNCFIKTVKLFKFITDLQQLVCKRSQKNN